MRIVYSPWREAAEILRPSRPVPNCPDDVAPRGRQFSLIWNVWSQGH
jgi:hypothetical protein